MGKKIFVFSIAFAIWTFSMANGYAAIRNEMAGCPAGMLQADSGCCCPAVDIQVQNVNQCLTETARAIRAAGTQECQALLDRITGDAPGYSICAAVQDQINQIKRQVVQTLPRDCRGGGQAPVLLAANNAGENDGGRDGDNILALV